MASLIPTTMRSARATVEARATLRAAMATMATVRNRCFPQPARGRRKEARRVAAERLGVQRQHDDVAEPQEHVDPAGEQPGAKCAVHERHGAAPAGIGPRQQRVRPRRQQRHQAGHQERDRRAASGDLHGQPEDREDASTDHATDADGHDPPKPDLPRFAMWRLGHPQPIRGRKGARRRMRRVSGSSSNSANREDRGAALERVPTPEASWVRGPHRNHRHRWEVDTETPPEAKGDEGRVEDQRSEEDRRSDEALRHDQGLSAEEAEARLRRYGPNAIQEEGQSLLLEIASHFWGPIPWMIEVALVLTAVTARWTDFAIILALLVLNGVVGFWEEHQAMGAIEALKGRMAKLAKVRRDGEWATLNAEALVPGDLVAVERGDIVPADALIVDGTAQTDESALTGESLPVEKHPGDEIYSGSIVTRGGPVARVLATGSRRCSGGPPSWPGWSLHPATSSGRSSRSAST